MKVCKEEEPVFPGKKGQLVKNCIGLSLKEAVKVLFPLCKNVHVGSISGYCYMGPTEDFDIETIDKIINADLKERQEDNEEIQTTHLEAYERGKELLNQKGLSKKEKKAAYQTCISRAGKIVAAKRVIEYCKSARENYISFADRKVKEIYRSMWYPDTLCICVSGDEISKICLKEEYDKLKPGQNLIYTYQPLYQRIALDETSDDYELIRLREEYKVFLAKAKKQTA